MLAKIDRLLTAAAGDPQLSEVGYLRELAGLVREIAEEERMGRIVRRWQEVNELGRPDRAPVWCRPVGCWGELLPDSSLLCQVPLHRQMEAAFRRLLIKYEIGDDEIVPGYWAVPPVIVATPGNWWGVEIGRHRSGQAGGAWRYDPPLKSPADFERLATPQFAYDAVATEARRQQFAEILGEAMPVRVVVAPGFDSATIVCSTYALLRGLEELMMDTLVEPEFAHRLCRHITEAQLRYLDTLEGIGLNATNADQPMLCSRPFGPPPVAGRYSLANCWCAGNSQEFDQISPAGFEEFLLRYQQEIFRRFGRVSYGCCENLTHKMDLVIDGVPNLRLLTCSAWTDFDRLVDRVGDRFAIMWRQKATDVVFARTIADLRRPMLEKCWQLRGSHYQVVLRELETLNGDLRRLHDWTRLAIDCVTAAG